jgi:hypothetical protein
VIRRPHAAISHVTHRTTRQPNHDIRPASQEMLGRARPYRATNDVCRSAKPEYPAAERRCHLADDTYKAVCGVGTLTQTRWKRAHRVCAAANVGCTGASDDCEPANRGCGPANSLWQWAFHGTVLPLGQVAEWSNARAWRALWNDINKRQNAAIPR